MTNIDSSLRAAQKYEPPSARQNQVGTYQSKPKLTRMELGEGIENIASTTQKLACQLEKFSEFLINDNKIGIWVKRHHN